MLILGTRLGSYLKKKVVHVTVEYHAVMSVDTIAYWMADEGDFVYWLHSSHVVPRFLNALFTWHYLPQQTAAFVYTDMPLVFVPS
jgi:hypothetical protein